MVSPRKDLPDETTLWLWMFSGIGLLFLFAQFNSSWGSVRILAGAICILVVTIIWFDWVSGFRSTLNARNIILCGVLFWIVLDPLQMREGIEEFPPDVVLWALFYVIVFIGALLAGYSLPPYHGVRRFFWRFGDLQKQTMIFWITLVVYILGFIPLIVESQGSLDYFWRQLFAGYSQATEVGWRREMLGDERDFLLSLADLLRLSIPLLGVWILRQDRFRVWEKCSALIMVITVLVVTFFTGQRRILAFVVLGPLFYLYLSLPAHVRRRWAIAFLGVPMILLWLMQAQVHFRAYGFYEFDFQTIETDPLRMHRDNNFYWLTMAVDMMPEFYDFTGEWVFLRLLIHPIPRFLWPEKPFSTGFPFISWTEAGSTLSTSVVGELYIAQSIWGIIIGGLIYGWAARNWDQLRPLAVGGNILILIYCLGLDLLVLGIRSFNDIASNWYVLGLVVLVAYIFSSTAQRQVSVYDLEANEFPRRSIST